MRDEYGRLAPLCAFVMPTYPHIEIENGMAKCVQKFYTEINEHITSQILTGIQKVSDEYNATVIVISESVVREMIDLYNEKYKEKE